MLERFLKLSDSIKDALIEYGEENLKKKKKF